MERNKLFKELYKNPQHDYELSETMLNKIKDRTPDIAFIYSGRNRGKSFEVSTQLLADAWYNDKEFMYIRRYEDITSNIELYFADKIDFIKIMTDEKADSINLIQGELYFTKTVKKGKELKRIKIKKVGYFVPLSKQNKYKSLQYPHVYNMLYEEVLTDDRYLTNEPEKLLNLYSTVKRHKNEVKLYLISNLISSVNPYSLAWGINFVNQKPNEIKLTKLYLGSINSEGKEDYLIIASHYLKDKNVLLPSDLKKGRNRIKTSITSNRWDELKRFATIDLKFMQRYEIIESVVFEYDDLLFLGNLVELPCNIIDYYNKDIDEDLREDDDNIIVLYITKKTTAPHEGDRLYTNDKQKIGSNISQGFLQIYYIDKIVDRLITQGLLIGSDNLTMNNFSKVFQNLKIYGRNF